MNKIICLYDAPAVRLGLYAKKRKPGNLCVEIATLLVKYS